MMKTSGQRARTGQPGKHLAGFGAHSLVERRRRCHGGCSIGPRTLAGKVVSRDALLKKSTSSTTNTRGYETLEAYRRHPPSEKFSCENNTSTLMV